MNATAFYSNYDYLIQFGSSDGQNFKWRSNIINYSLKTDFIYYLNTRNTIRFGAQSLLYNFKPYDAISTFENANVNFVADRRYGIESSIFVGVEQKIFEKLTFEYGLRLSIYNYLGKGTAYYFRDTIANTTLPLQNSKNYEFGQIIQSYLNPEPRFSANYLLNSSSSIKISYNRMAQYIQLISNTAASTPLDVYTIASNNLKPLTADQGSLGYFKNFKNNMFES